MTNKRKKKMFVSSPLDDFNTLPTVYVVRGSIIFLTHAKKPTPSHTLHIELHAHNTPLAHNLFQAIWIGIYRLFSTSVMKFFYRMNVGVVVVSSLLVVVFINSSLKEKYTTLWPRSVNLLVSMFHSVIMLSWYLCVRG